ncbi:Formate/nitrite transporter [compost metagenome]
MQILASIACQMFVIPAGMMLGADVSFTDWWLWNQLPVLFGNFIGGVVFTGLLLYISLNKSIAPQTVPYTSHLSLKESGDNMTAINRVGENL